MFEINVNLFEKYFIENDKHWTRKKKKKSDFQPSVIIFFPR